MRPLLLLLSIYISFLTVVPCEHINNPTDAVRIESTNQIPADQQNSSHCSPFCVCSCCNTLVVMNHEKQPLKGLAFESELTSLYLAIHPSQVFLPIWQPPKLV